MILWFPKDFPSLFFLQLCCLQLAVPQHMGGLLSVPEWPFQVYILSSVLQPGLGSQWKLPALKSCCGHSSRGVLVDCKHCPQLKKLLSAGLEMRCGVKGCGNPVSTGLGGFLQELSR